MRKPMPEKYPKGADRHRRQAGPAGQGAAVRGRAPARRLHGRAGAGAAGRASRRSRASPTPIPNYEGRIGASPREMKLLLMNAAQSPKFACVSPFAVFEELEDLVSGVSVYEFLKQEPLPGGYHENRKFIFQVRDRLIDKHRRRSAHVDGPGRRAPLHRSIRTVRVLRLALDSQGEGHQPRHRPRRGSRRRVHGRGRADAGDAEPAARTSAAR